MTDFDYDHAAGEIAESIVNGNITANLIWMGLEDAATRNAVTLALDVIAYMGDIDGGTSQDLADNFDRMRRLIKETRL